MYKQGMAHRGKCMGVDVFVNQAVGGIIGGARVSI
jgi:hypothetical protein